MILLGRNEINGIFVNVVIRKGKVKRGRIKISVINEREIVLKIPNVDMLKKGEEFLQENWQWVLNVQARFAEYYKNFAKPVTQEDIGRLQIVLEQLNEKWARLLGENGVQLKIRNVKSYWGSCNSSTRVITYNAKLFHVPIELIEYVVVHEFTHLSVPNHGPDFRALMDKRLPNWKILRHRLRRGEW